MCNLQVQKSGGLFSVTNFRNESIVFQSRAREDLIRMLQSLKWREQPVFATILLNLKHPNRVFNRKLPSAIPYRQ